MHAPSFLLSFLVSGGGPRSSVQTVFYVTVFHVWKSMLIIQKVDVYAGLKHTLWRPALCLLKLLLSKIFSNVYFGQHTHFAGDS